MIHHQECSSYQTKMIWPLCVFCLPFSKLLNLDRINAVITRGILVRAGLANYHKIGNFKCQMTNLNVKFQLHWPLLWPGLYGWQLKSCQQICKKIHLKWLSVGLSVEFCYLGDMLSVDGDADAAVEARIWIGWNELRQLVPLLTNKDVSLIKRGRLYSSCVRSSMLHGSETWPVSSGGDFFWMVGGRGGGAPSGVQGQIPWSGGQRGIAPLKLKRNWILIIQNPFNSSPK